MVSTPLFKENDLVRLIMDKIENEKFASDFYDIFGDLFIVTNIELEDTTEERLLDQDKEYFPFYECKNSNGTVLISESFLVSVDANLSVDITKYSFIKNEIPTRVEQINSLFSTDY